MAKHVRHFIALLLLMSAAGVEAQEFTGAEKHLWTPISPIPGNEIENGSAGIYIRVAFNKDYSIVANSVRIFVDDRMLDGNVKVLANNTFTAVYTLPLKPGKHKVAAEVISTTGFIFEPFEWVFYVKQPADSLIRQPRDTFKVAGNIVAETRITSLSGPGSTLRQEPPHTTQLSADIRLQNSKYTFGFRGFYTSDEYLYQRNFQSRNYFQVTAGYKGIHLTAGDMNPVFDRLVLTGTRVKGAMLAFKYRHIELKLIRGLLAREVEGQRLQLGTNEQATPNLQDDSAYIVPGTYRRTISAFRIQFRTIAEGSRMGFTIMRSKDVVNSINYGVAPKDNFVIGVDQVITGYDQRIKFSYGVAVSGFTNDISKGPITKAEIDSVLGDPNNPFDPQKWTGILIINESTLIPSRRSVTTYLNTTIRLSKNHQLFVENRKFGEAYVSFGNPFVRADQRSWEVQERFSFFSRAISGYIRYQYLQNNLSRQSFTTLLTNSYNGMININPGKKWPQLTVTALQQERRNQPAGSGEVSIYFLNNDNILTYTASLLYTLKTGSLSNIISLNTVQSQRKDLINPLNNNNTRIYSAGLQQNFGFPLSLNYQYSTTQILLNNTAYRPMTSTYSIAAQYKFFKKTLEAGAGYFTNLMATTPFSTASSRPLLRVYGNYKGFKNKFKPLTLYIEAATAPYTDEVNAMNNYTETYVYVRASYLLGY